MRLRAPQPAHLAAAALFAVLVVGAALLTRGREDVEEGRGVPSTYSNAPEGLRALFLACETVRIPVLRWTQSLELLDPSVTALVAIARERDPHDIGPLRKWVENGGRLLLGVIPFRRGPGGELPGLFEEFRLSTEPVEEGEIRLGAEIADLPPGLSPPERTFLVPPDESALPLAELVDRGEAKPWILSLPFGRGEILAVADASFLPNERFGAAASSVLAVRLIERVSRGEAVGFCESIHGYLEGDSPAGVLWTVLRGTKPGRFALQAGGAALLLLLAGAPRFGRIRRVAQAPRRSEIEHVEAVAGLLRRSGAWRDVARLLAEGVRRRWNLPPTRPGTAPDPGPRGAIEDRISSLASADDPRRIASALEEIESALRARSPAASARA